ncbi:acyl carrier protein [Rhodococcoides fascians]|jgi:acyl carrier protein|uniref:acyl carrier protein n=1 Tax=Nocardiaceae TaxID=85025 RepID=UPI00344FBD70
MTIDDVRDIWSRNLKLDQSAIGDDDDFFTLGGHSLIMAEIQNEFADSFGIEVAMDDLFRRPTVGQIAAYLDTQRSVV